jgi:hypothetical protein
MVKIRIKVKLPLGSGPKSANNHTAPPDNDSPDPPPDPPGGEGGDKKHIKHVLNTTGSSYQETKIESLVLADFGSISSQTWPRDPPQGVGL